MHKNASPSREPHTSATRKTHRLRSHYLYQTQHEDIQNINSNLVLSVFIEELLLPATLTLVLETAPRTSAAIAITFAINTAITFASLNHTEKKQSLRSRNK